MRSITAEADRRDMFLCVVREKTGGFLLVGRAPKNDPTKAGNWQVLVGSHSGEGREERGARFEIAECSRSRKQK